MSEKKNKIFIIAEAGVNHNGGFELAKEMIDAAASSGADAIKFQSFRAENIVSEGALKAEYQKKNTLQEESQLEMLKRLELSYDDQKKLAEHCIKKNIKFMSSPFDLESIDMLQKMGMDIFKIPSGEIVNLPYLQKIGSLKKKVILSTGMSDLTEIGQALAVLVASGTLKEDITVLHCNTDYPTPMSDANIRAMITIGNRFDVTIGYSDHTEGFEATVAAVALGAKVIEKHFTLNKNMEGPDHRASVNPDELKSMVTAIRNIEIALGDGEKRITDSEMKNREIIRKSIVAARAIEQGEIFTGENLTVKRPAKGISPMRWKEVLGENAKRIFEKGEIIEL